MPKFVKIPLLILIVETAGLFQPAIAQAYLLGDFNLDCKVDYRDLQLLSNCWLNTNSMYYKNVDLNHGNSVDMVEYAILAKNWLKHGKVYPYRWVFVSNMLGSANHLEQLINIIETASKHGLNGIVLDCGIDKLDLRPVDYIPTYMRRFEKVKQTCRQYDMEIIPIGFGVGYGGDVLAYDKNLATGIPVKDALFVVENYEAHLVPDPPVQIINGGFEEYEGNRFSGYEFHDKPGEISFVDTTVFRNGKASIRFENFNGSSARVMQQVHVQPYRCYKLSCWIKTDGFRPEKGFNMIVLASDEGVLASWKFSVPSTADWRKLTMGFNSLNYNLVRVYLGTWTGEAGKLWIDDLSIDEVGLLNVLRRPGTPVTVRGEDTGTIYEEGQDFAYIEDPVLDFKFDRDPPSIRILQEGTGKIHNGERLRVSYYHGTAIGDAQVTICMSEPKVYDIWKKQFKLVHDYLAPNKYFLSMDEIRAGGSCEACKKRGLIMAKILGDCITRQVQLIRENNPNAEVFIWSDMLDPNHNAHDNYYLVEGDFTGSWKYVPADLVVVCWDYEKRSESLNFFSNHGFRTLAGAYYDDDTLDNPRGWLEALEHTQGACGIMYTTWRNKYELLADFGDLVKCVPNHE
ncbi:MAG: hypothetical protein A2167_06280 [Planctomycetes bacterium RBG_13_46_10]|nr:MAG: hypothetical protein A2167_06280 [Planctomycetes bacterium RBG_13_46_10]